MAFQWLIPVALACSIGACQEGDGNHVVDIFRGRVTEDRPLLYKGSEDGSRAEVARDVRVFSRFAEPTSAQRSAALGDEWPTGTSDAVTDHNLTVHCYAATDFKHAASADASFSCPRLTRTDNSRRRDHCQPPTIIDAECMKNETTRMKNHYC